MVKDVAAKLLRETESKIAGLSTDAAKARDYDTAEKLLGIARQLAATADRLATPPVVSASAAGAPQALSGPVVDDEADSGTDTPVFEREGNELVKTGNSNNDAKSYEHKAPRSAVDALLRAIKEGATKKGEFRTSKIFPLVEPDGRKLPGYQGYLCLRWLRQIGLVRRIGRQRYQFIEGHDPVTTVESAWHSLHQR